MKEIILNYLIEFSENDENFKTKFDQSLIDKVINYITNQAKEHLKGKNGAIEDDLVFKWARDYFNDDIFLKEKEEEEKRKKEQKEREEKNKQEQIKREEERKLSEEERKQKEQKENIQKMYEDESSLFFGME